MSEPRFYPTLAIAFITEAGERSSSLILHQWWACNTGGGEWRKVPTVSRYHEPNIPERNYPATAAGVEPGEEEQC